MAKKRKKKQQKILPAVAVLLIALIFAVLWYFDLIPIPSPSEGSEGSDGPAESTSESDSHSSDISGSPSESNNSGDASVESNAGVTVITSAELSIHFLELGNKYTGDCTYIKVGDVDILIDAGSRTNSISTIAAYLDDYVTDGILEYVIVTHAHQDHYAGFATSESKDSIFDLYVCETIIDFALTNQNPDGTMYSNYVRERNDEIEAGAVHYTAAECIQGGNNVFVLSETVSLEILDNYYYYNKSSDENNYSVCCLITEGDRNYLFTGDLEKEGEEYLVELNELPEVELFKAGHHGSPTSTTVQLLEVIKPQYVTVCCCCGSSEYTSNTANQFPSQAFIDRVALYTQNVYVTTLCVDYANGDFTSMNGNVVFYVIDDTLTISCSASTLPLYLSDWFTEYRTCPDAWKEAIGAVP